MIAPSKSEKLPTEDLAAARVAMAGDLASGDVRVEGTSSIGRSYGGTSMANLVRPGIGAERKQLRTLSFSLPDDENTTSSDPMPDLSAATREEMLGYFRNTWGLNSTLFSALRDDSVFYSVPDTLRRPLIFYFAHPACVYVNKLNLAGLLPNVHPLFQKMFETGVDELSWDDMDELQSEDFAWPTVAEAAAFRDDVKSRVEALMATLPPPAESPITQADPRWALPMGFEHERIHIETSSVLIRQLPVSSVRRPAKWTYAPSRAASPADAPENELVRVPAAQVTLGKPDAFPSFGWDNEYGRRVVDVPAFRASKFLVTNADFLPFVLDGGYTDQRWWVAADGDDEGWRWRTFRNATHPSFWVATTDMPQFRGGLPGRPYQKDDCAAEAGTGPHFRLRAMFDIIDMPWDWPAEVNYLEAKAYARWRSHRDGVHYRLPTEAEHHRIRGEGPWDGEQGEAWAQGARPADTDPVVGGTAPGNVNMRFGSPSAVDAFPPSPTGFHDAHGNVWQWAEDHFAPLPGFKIHRLYDDFSTPCFDGWHTTILGGSWISTGDQASRFARYQFRRHFFQHLGFRLCVTDAAETWDGSSSAASLWETKGRLSQLCAADFPDSVPRTLPTALDASYPTRVAELVLRAAAERGDSSPSVLVVGANLGGVAFALAAGGAARCLAVDADEDTIRSARVLLHHGELEFACSTEGILSHSRVAKVPGDPTARARVSFECEAPENLASNPIVAAGGPFDVVLVDDVLVRMKQPLRLLEALGQSTRPGGTLVVSSSNAWQADVTPRNAWLGGFKMNGEEQSTLDGLKHRLREFALEGTHDVPRVHRTDARSFALAVMEVSVWTRNADNTGDGDSEPSSRSGEAKCSPEEADDQE